jgi:hypothetical protein
LRFILAAQALADEWDADWHTWDTVLTYPTTKKGSRVPLRGLRMYIAENGEYYRGEDWESELGEQTLFPHQAAHYRWGSDQQELRGRLGPNVVVFAFERLNYRFESDASVNIVGTEEVYYAVTVDNTFLIPTEDRGTISELYHGTKTRVHGPKSKLHAKAEQEESRLLTELQHAKSGNIPEEQQFYINQVFAILFSD